MKKFVRKGRAAFVCISVLLLTGCGGQKDENENRIVVEQETTQDYNLIEITKGDVVLSKRIRCTYQTMESHDYAFQVSKKNINRVYVEQGDLVRKGQLLAETGEEGVQQEIDRLSYQIARYQLLIGQTKQNLDFDISSQWISFQKNGSKESDEEGRDAAIEKLKTNARYKIEDYQDAMDMAQMELDLIYADIADGKILADMDGVVSYVKQGMEGTQSTEGEVVIKIADKSQGIFVSDDTTYKDYIKEGQQCTLTINTGATAGDYLLLPMWRDKWEAEDKLYFEMADPQSGAALTMGVLGYMNIVLEEKTGVIRAPKNAVRTADGKNYVYIVGENEIREVKWIETGLEGDEFYEVISGLEEGEKVIAQWDKKLR